MSDLGTFSGHDDDASDPHPPEFATGRMISLRYITSALRRRRRFWVALAVVGLIIGGGFHAVAPKSYTATTTIYLAHPSGSNDSVVSANDLAMVKTVGVGQRAISLLHEPRLSPLKLLGTAPAKAPSDNILVLTISGPTPQEAVRRVNAVTGAYLSFRADQYNAQNQGVISATDRQIAKLQAEVNHLTGQINGTPASHAQGLSTLIGQRSTLESQITSLQQTVQADDLAAVSVSQGSRVVTHGTLVPVSKKKQMAIDGASGMVGGLGTGLIVVILLAVLSEKLWRREDIAGVLGAPVELSIARSRRRPRRRFSIAKQAARPKPALQGLVHFLHDRLVKEGSRRVGMVVAIDEVRPAATAAAALAGRLSSNGRDVVLVDGTPELTLAKAFGLTKPGVRQARVGDSPDITVVAPPKAWETFEDDEWWERMQDQLAGADTVLMVATVDPAYGAGHLRRWASQAIVTVTAGRSTAQRVNVVSELLDAANVRLTSAVLLDAEASDDSIGFPDPLASRSIREPDVLSDALGALPATEPR